MTRQKPSSFLDLVTYITHSKVCGEAWTAGMTEEGDGELGIERKATIAVEKESELRECEKKVII